MKQTDDRFGIGKDQINPRRLQCAICTMDGKTRFQPPTREIALNSAFNLIRRSGETGEKIKIPSTPGSMAMSIQFRGGESVHIPAAASQGVMTWWKTFLGDDLPALGFSCTWVLLAKDSDPIETCHLHGKLIGEGRMIDPSLLEQIKAMAQVFASAVIPRTYPIR